MATIVEFLSNEHRCCDESFAATEEAAQTGDLLRCRTDFRQFQAAMEHHFEKEEAMLFPAFEQASGNTMGPTRVMRLEHRQMRETLAEMDGALASGDLEDFLGQAETLLILMQQHNIKEEQILYPMCDRFLGGAVESVLQAMRDLPGRQPT
jgi:iron-sulfur cluster repair protein YtfE (RIC family)